MNERGREGAFSSETRMTNLAPRPRIFVQTSGPLTEERPRGPVVLRSSLRAGASPLAFRPLTPAEEVRRGLEMTLGTGVVIDTDG